MSDDVPCQLVEEVEQEQRSNFAEKQAKRSLISTKFWEECARVHILEGVSMNFKTRS